MNVEIIEVGFSMFSCALFEACCVTLPEIQKSIIAGFSRTHELLYLYREML